MGTTRLQVSPLSRWALAFCVVLGGAAAAGAADYETEAAGSEPAGHADEGREATEQEGDQAHEGEHSSRLSGEALPLLVDELPKRPGLLVELGNPYLGTGSIDSGFKVPGGAVWQPTLIVFGTFRTAVQTFEAAETRFTEWASRLDLFANLQLTSTEKCLVGIGVADKNRFTNFTRYSFESTQGDEGWNPEFGGFVRALFCEGDFGSLFPKLDPKGTSLIDYGFSFGRQQITFQEGVMINDVLDAVGVVRNNLHLPGFSNIRLTGLFAWDSIDRGSPATRLRLDDPGLFGIFTQGDTANSTFNLDFITIQDHESNSTGGDGYWLGLSATQRGWFPWSGSGAVNTTYRINASFADDADSPQVSDGLLLSSEMSWTPHSSDDIVYVNSFWGLDRYTQASREPIVGGPLAPLGISFASPSLGNYLSELSSFNSQVVGVAIGYQAFWDNHRRNLVIEIAGIKDTTRGLFKTDGPGGDGTAITVQFQQALGQRVQLQLDGFVSYLEGRRNGTGLRAEILVQF